MTQYLLVSVGPPPESPPQELVMEAAQRRLRSDPAHHAEGTVLASRFTTPAERGLCVAAESFVFGDGTAIIAGYPWLDVWSRDTLLALPGIYLVRDQVERAKRSIRHLIRNMREGLLVSRTTVPEKERVPCLDASLWLFPIGQQVLAHSPEDIQFNDDFYHALLEVYRRVTSKGPDMVWLTDDGLLAGRAEFALTWMEASSAGHFYTPRRGLAVELQALWVRACTVLAEHAERRADPELADQARQNARRTQEAFANTFWCYETNHPFDCMSEERESAEAWADPSIRPNALIALSVAPELFEPWQASEILVRVEELLLTPKGIRTLEPGHPDYLGYAGETVEENQASSHQGAAWMHLLAFYARAKMRVSPQSRADLRELIESSIEAGRALGYVWQIADGDPPHRVRGIPAYAISTGMLLEILSTDLS